HLAAQAFRLAAARKTDRYVAVPGQIGEDAGRASAIVDEGGVRQADAPSALPEDGGHPGDAVRRLDAGAPSEEVAVGERENRRVHADAESEGHDSAGGERLAAAQRAEGEPEIVDHGDAQRARRLPTV